MLLSLLFSSLLFSSLLFSSTHYALHMRYLAVFTDYQFLCPQLFYFDFVDVAVYINKMIPFTEKKKKKNN